MRWGCLIQGVLFCRVAEQHRCHGSIIAYEACVHWEFKSPIFFMYFVLHYFIQKF